MSSDGVGGSDDRGSGWQRGNDPSLSQTHRLLLHGLQQGLLLLAQLIELVDAAQTCREQEVETFNQSSAVNM